MKKIFFFLCLCILIFASSQTTRFIYQASIKADSTDANSVKTELVNLDISPTKSIFYSDNRFKRDSLFSRARQTGSFNFDRTQMENLQSNLDFVIEKNYTDQSLIFKSRIGGDQYSYAETPQFNWKILPETVKIGDYKTQKAEMNYGGRTWNAWFTTDIPLQDGPYKFSGLPGLIVKVEDTKGNYSFDLMQSKKIENPAEFTTRGNTVKLSKKDFQKQTSIYRKDPVATMTAGNSGGNWMQRLSPEQRKEIETRMKQNVQKFNNLIELN